MASITKVIIKKAYFMTWSERFNSESELIITELEVFNLIQSFSERKLPVLDSDEDSFNIYVFTDCIGKFIFVDSDSYYGESVRLNEAACLHWLIENSTDLETLKHQQGIVKGWRTHPQYVYPTFTYSNATGLVPYQS
jgi:hypothetical protein